MIEIAVLDYTPDIFRRAPVVPGTGTLMPFRTGDLRWSTTSVNLLHHSGHPKTQLPVVFRDVYASKIVKIASRTQGIDPCHG
jgi:hypothetical protein